MTTGNLWLQEGITSAVTPPPDPVRNWGDLLSRTWSWAWVPPIFSSSLLVRFGDMDGWVEQGGHILLLDGLIGYPSADKPSKAVQTAVRNAGNVTWVGLCAEPDQFDYDTHQPKTVSYYHILKGPWPAPAWQWGKWMRADERASLWQMTALFAQWSAWAHFKDS